MSLYYLAFVKVGAAAAGADAGLAHVASVPLAEGCAIADLARATIREIVNRDPVGLFQSSFGFDSRRNLVRRLHRRTAGLRSSRRCR